MDFRASYGSGTTKGQYHDFSESFRYSEREGRVHIEAEEEIGQEWWSVKMSRMSMQDLGFKK